MQLNDDPASGCEHHRTLARLPEQSLAVAQAAPPSQMPAE
jgi:hypothetical protein